MRTVTLRFDFDDSPSILRLPRLEHSDAQRAKYRAPMAFCFFAFTNIPDQHFTFQRRSALAVARRCFACGGA